MCNQEPSNCHAQQYFNLICPYLLGNDAVKRQLGKQASQTNPLWQSGGKMLLENICHNYAQQQKQQLPAHLLPSSNSKPAAKPAARQAAGTELSLRIKGKLVELQLLSDLQAKKEPTDAEIIFGTYSGNLYKRCKSDWERPRLEWLYELERESQPVLANVGSAITQPTVQRAKPKRQRFWRLLCCGSSVDTGSIDIPMV